jgi:hypothetical protein
MKSEELKQVTCKAIEELNAALAAGRTEELTCYLEATSRFHRYSDRPRAIGLPRMRRLRLQPDRRPGAPGHWPRAG